MFGQSYTGMSREFQRAALAAKLAHLGTDTFRHIYRSCLDAVGMGMAVQQKVIRRAVIRATFDLEEDVVTGEMTTAGIKVAEMDFALPERKQIAA